MTRLGVRGARHAGDEAAGPLDVTFTSVPRGGPDRRCVQGRSSRGPARLYPLGEGRETIASVPAFISYSQKDAAAFSTLRLVFQALHIDYWDPASMQAGGSLRAMLRRAIEECDVCVFLATKRSLESDWCRAELGAFWGAGKRVIVYRSDPEVEPETLPPQLRDDLWTEDAAKVVAVVQSEIESARLQRPRPDDDLKRAICRIEGRQQTIAGTGYLVGPRLVATCSHLIPPKMSPFTAKFWCQKETMEARVVVRGEPGEPALLELSSEPATAPLEIRGECEAGDVCRGFGFPRIARGAGLPFGCEVLDPKQTDESGLESIVVHIPDVFR